MTLPGGAGIADYDWYNNSLLKRVTYPNGTLATYSFDEANRVTAIDNLGPGNAPLSSYAYEYDANGNRNLQHEINGGALEITTYSYDRNDRLWQVVYPDQTTTYSFDAVGNRKSELSEDGNKNTLADRRYNYDDRNQLYEITDHLDPSRSVSYTYDVNGNQIQRTQDSTALDFRYDARDQLLEVDVDGSNAWTFGFDFRGLRVTKWGADGLLRYTYDDNSVLQQHSAMGDPVATYRYGPDRLLAVDHFSQGTAYYHFDALGSIANLTDPSGTVQNRYQYDAWGNHRTQSGTQWNPFGFTGHEYDEETGLYYAKARFYDPEVGRFLTEDPAEPDLTTPPSLHRYLYAYGNPTRYWDPFGLQSVEIDDDDYERWRRTHPEGSMAQYFDWIDERYDAAASQREAERSSSWWNILAETTSETIDDLFLRKWRKRSKDFSEKRQQAKLVEEETNELRASYTNVEDDRALAAHQNGRRTGTGEQAQAYRSVVVAGVVTAVVIADDISMLTGAGALAKHGFEEGMQVAVKNRNGRLELFKVVDGEFSPQLIDDATERAIKKQTIASRKKPRWKEYEEKHGGEQTPMETTFEGTTIKVRLDRPPTDTKIVDFKDYNWGKGFYSECFGQDCVRRDFTDQIQKYQTIRPDVHIQFSQEPPTWVEDLLEQLGATFSVKP